MANPTALYSYQGGEPRPLPHEIFYTESWGATTFRQGVESFTEEELAKAGYTGPYKLPNFDQEYQRLFWDSNKFKYVVEDIPEEELWERIRKERNNLLSQSDWTMLGDIAGSKKINLNEWMKYRQRLRDLPFMYQNPKDVVFPISPDNQESFELDYDGEFAARHRIVDLEQLVQELRFYTIKPYPSWSFDWESKQWRAPIEKPTSEPEDGTFVYDWDEKAYQKNNTTGWFKNRLV